MSVAATPILLGGLLTALGITSAAGTGSPRTPVQTPLLFTVLAWVRREFETTSVRPLSATSAAVSPISATGTLKPRLVAAASPSVAAGVPAGLAHAPVQSLGEILRYTFFNQAPTADPVQSPGLPDTGVITGDLNAGPPGVVQTYSLARPPTRGSVEIGPDGTYIYTPGTVLAGTGGRDNFSVTIDDGGAYRLNGPVGTIQGVFHSLAQAIGLSQSDTITVTVGVRVAGINPQPPPPGPSGPPGDWTLTFEDTFDSSFDYVKWSDSWFNGGTQNRVTTSKSNVAIVDGNLRLTLSSSSVGASVNTNPSDKSGNPSKVGFTIDPGDVVEVRALFPGNGTSLYNWSAIWTTGQSWPEDGEHDFAEVLGGDLEIAYHSIGVDLLAPTPTGYWGDGWHTYTLHRKISTTDVYRDGELVATYDTSDTGNPECIVINTGYKSGVSVLATGSASYLWVDHVRAWTPV
jgi:hypothetical protein